MQKLNKKIVAILPVRNEAEYLPQLLASLAAQTVTPTECIFVDDGSTDETSQILQTAAENYPWVRYVHKADRGARSVGPGVVEAFYYGYECIESDDWDFIAKMDGDITISPRYFETLLSYFENDPHLGSASGKVFCPGKNGNFHEERISDEMVAGCLNFYRRECFQAVGGFVREVMWDGIVYHRARISGWRTRSIKNKNLDILHHRLMGSSHKNVLHGRARWGYGQYFMGTHPLYVLAIGIYRSMEKPFILGGMAIVYGYFRAMFRGDKRYGDTQFRRSLHAWQFERLKIGRRLESIPEAAIGLYR